MKLDNVCVGDVLTVTSREKTQQQTVTRVNKNYVICGDVQFNRQTGNQKATRGRYTNLFLLRVVAINKNEDL